MIPFQLAREQAEKAASQQAQGETSVQSAEISASSLSFSPAVVSGVISSPGAVVPSVSAGVTSGSPTVIPVASASEAISLSSSVDTAAIKTKYDTVITCLLISLKPFIFCQLYHGIADLFVFIFIEVMMQLQSEVLEPA